MDELLRGNYSVDQPKQDLKPAPTLEDEFEVAALKRLGGSMTFVARRKVIWHDAPSDTANGMKDDND